MLNINSVIVVICLGRKSQLMEQILELTDVSLTILDITINVVSIQESFKNKNPSNNSIWCHRLGSLEFKVWTNVKMASRAVNGTKKSMVGEVEIAKDLTKTGLNVTVANLVIVRTALVRDQRIVDLDGSLDMKISDFLNISWIPLKCLCRCNRS